ncbi:ABC transporter, ATP-binding protein (cluster 2, ribose/xylose/arabinose/galactose) / ABC transporter, ATP-binding protein (cluster 2, ribose/xylose/arabinose/galactose) [Olavius sp. associated proteobacterium Delta 1]|nr:ABC transporter, ATP-binding protein (cluster 2, ribose/xylose/arabinose/galactose) / ABC transporter, ATP-binding protein (cluster 2, ribose/xylose/arabinose/galactose) [Olavius sp. associated proteobacterium Delta 1]
MTTSALQVENATKNFPGVKALDSVSLDLQPGEIHALLGENGAGKSTLIKIITGVYRPDEGKIQIAGEPVNFTTPQQALNAGIGTVHQERNLIPHYSIAENIMLDRLPTKFGLIDRTHMRQQAKHWLGVLDLYIDPDLPVRRLSVAQMQLVEIARALSMQSRILLLDEPTASITGNEIAILFNLLRRLKDEGVAILFVSHKLEEVFELCDKVTILRDGRNASESVLIKELDKQKIVAHMIGRDEDVGDIGQRKDKLGSTKLELKDVSTAQGHHRINLQVKEGEVLGLYGLVGAGRSELARAIMGAERITGGEIRIDGKPARIKSVQDALQNWRIGYVSENRKEEGLILPHSVAKNTGITIWHRLGKVLSLFTDAMERLEIKPFVEKLNVITPSLEQSVGNLSGGNQQKVSVAKWLAAKVEILIIDEPTVGIDIRTKGYLHRLIWNLAEQGVAVLLISSDMPEMVLLADRVVVMKDMQIVGNLPNSHQYEGMSSRIMNCIHESGSEVDETVEDGVLAPQGA